MVCVGLHIPKCAGTSLAQVIKTQFQPRQYYLCSAPFWHLRDASIELMERLDFRTQVEFIFGHYVHQSLLGLFPLETTLLFTGLREPIARAQSEYFQYAKIALHRDAPIPSAEDHVRTNSNAMCKHLLNAFPAFRGGGGNLADSAFDVLGMFEFIYDSANFAEDSNYIAARMGLQPVVNIFENVTSRLAEENEEVARQAGLIREMADEFYDQDLMLYERARPLLSRKDMEFRRAAKAYQRAFFDKHVDQQTCVADARHYLAGAMFLDAGYLGRIDVLRDYIEQKRLSVEALVSYLERYSDR